MVDFKNTLTVAVENAKYINFTDIQGMMASYYTQAVIFNNADDMKLYEDFKQFCEDNGLEPTMTLAEALQKIN